VRNELVLAARETMPDSAYGAQAVEQVPSVVIAVEIQAASLLRLKRAWHCTFMPQTAGS